MICNCEKDSMCIEYDRPDDEGIMFVEVSKSEMESIDKATCFCKAVNILVKQNFPYLIQNYSFKAPRRMTRLSWQNLLHYFNPN